MMKRNITEEYVGGVGWHLLVAVHEGEIREEINGKARAGVAGRQSPLHTHLSILIYEGMASDKISDKIVVKVENVS